MNNTAVAIPPKTTQKRGRRVAWFALLLLTLTVLAIVIIPVILIMPFSPQSARGVAIAYTLRRWSPYLTLILAALSLAVVVWLWRGTRWWRKPAFAIALILIFAATWFARQNHFEWMFNPLPNAAYAKASDAGFMSDGDMVLAVVNQGEAVAYPIRSMAYHHIVQDTVGGTPVIATYCTLCHTGQVWEASVDGRLLHFRLAGINNLNAVIRDEETGSWWQQVTGEAIIGPLKGHRLKPLFHDEISFALWKREQPQGRVLRPDERVAALYAKANWEERMSRVPVLPQFEKVGQDPEPRALVIGISLNGAAKAYPLTALQKQSPIIDSVGGVPLIILVGDDHRSVRAFETTIDGRPLELLAKPGVVPLQLVDGKTGSLWDFSGRATAGELVGQQLKKVALSEEYWFDWKYHNPKTAFYDLGSR